MFTIICLIFMQSDKDPYHPFPYKNMWFNYFYVTVIIKNLFSRVTGSKILNKLAKKMSNVKKESYRDKMFTKLIFRFLLDWITAPLFIFCGIKVLGYSYTLLMVNMFQRFNQGPKSFIYPILMTNNVCWTA